MKSIDIISVFVAITTCVLTLFVQRKYQRNNMRKQESDIKSKSKSYLDRLPDIEYLNLISIGSKYRARFIISNMKVEPFKINYLKLYKECYRSSSLFNIILNKSEEYYTEVAECFWNPKGNFDYSEKYMQEATKFLVVKFQEEVLVTIKDKNSFYKIEIGTTDGVVTATFRPRASQKTLFPNNFYKEYQN